MSNMIFLSLILTFLFSIINCSRSEERNKNLSFNNRNEGLKQLHTPGIVKIRTDIIQINNDTIEILNENKDSVIFKIYSLDNNEPELFPRINQIFAYYPEYYIVLFEGYPLENNFYKLIIDNEIYYLGFVEGVTKFESWEDHIKTSLIITTENNPLRENPNDTSSIKENLDYDKLNFKVIQVQENWIYLKCNKDCEGCPNNMDVEGWVKWRKDNFLTLNLYYNC